MTGLDLLSRPGRHVISIRVDDRERKFVFVTPSGFRPGLALPLVFFFHGAGGTAEQAARTYGWAEKAEAENFFAIFPQGLGFRPDGSGVFYIWRDGRGKRSADVDDFHFFEVLLDQFQSLLPIDPRRIYVTGFSNGAGLTFALGARFSERIAAIAPVSSQSFVRSEALARPLPIYYLVSKADPLSPFHGGEPIIPTFSFGPGYKYPPVQDSVEAWVRLNGCPPEPQLVSDENGVRVVCYGPGRDEAEILFTTVEGNGHHWPGTVELLPAVICGPTLDPFHATDRIWDFFARHPLR